VCVCVCMCVCVFEKLIVDQLLNKFVAAAGLIEGLRFGPDVLLVAVVIPHESFGIFLQIRSLINFLKPSG